MYVWMDADYNQYEVEAENMGDALNYLEDGMALEVVFYDGKAISVELPTSVEREITWTEPAVKGDTSGKVLKPAKIATGFEGPVPLFVNQGDKIEIDTRTGEYRKRVWSQALRQPPHPWVGTKKRVSGFFMSAGFDPKAIPKKAAISIGNRPPGRAPAPPRCGPW